MFNNVFKGAIMKLDEKAYLIYECVQIWLEDNNENEINAKELMPFLIKKGIYKKEKNKGNLLIPDLIKIKERNLLYIIKGLEAVSTSKETNWIFHKI